MQFKDVHWQLYDYIDFSFVLCTSPYMHVSKLTSDHTKKKKKKQSVIIFFSPLKWKLLNRKAISPQTEIADSSQSVF